MYLLQNCYLKATYDYLTESRGLYMYQLAGYIRIAYLI